MPVIEVAVGVILNEAGEVLISYRHPDTHQGDLWEFPGGKLEAGETVEQALARELREELGLEVHSSFPLMRIQHEYADKAVVLHVRRIGEWTGTARGLEGQAIAWRALQALDSNLFPAANKPIIKVLRLPRCIAITPAVRDLAALEQVFDRLLSQPLPLIQLRQNHVTAACYRDWFQRMRDRCEAHDRQLIFNGELADFQAIRAAGYHANSARLQGLPARPVAENQLFSASCHDLKQLRQAEALRTDFVTLSPVGATSKYAPSATLGWEGFRQLAAQVNLPVYGLGGLTRAELALAWQAGAHGICGIRTFASWDRED